MAKKLVASLIVGFLVTGCSVEVPNGYRPSQSPASGASVTELKVSERESPVEISGPGLDGIEVSTTDMPGIVVVNAWASWCPPCREEWPIFEEIQQEYPDVNLLGLNEADDINAAKDFLGTQNGNWPHISDPNQAIAIKSNVLDGSYLPGTIILDKQHRIAAKFIGQVTKDDLVRILDQLASE